MENFTNRCYGIVVLRSENSNWNADFTGYPRRLPDDRGTIYATDKAFKYAVRRYLVDTGKYVFVWRSFNENGNPRSLEERDNYFVKNEELMRKWGIDTEQIKEREERKKYFSHFIDVKFFGITFAKGSKDNKENFSITGPLQISYGVNRFNKNTPFVNEILSPYSTKEDAKATTLGNEVKNLLSYYVYDFVLNPMNLPEGMSITHNEVETMKEAMRKCATYINSTTKIGTENVLLLFIQLKNESKLQLPTLKRLVDVDEDETIHLERIRDLLKKYSSDHIEKVEYYVNNNVCKVAGADESWKEHDILA